MGAQEQVSVIQADREAARLIADALPENFPLWLGRALADGADDNHPLVQAIARARGES